MSIDRPGDRAGGRWRIPVAVCAVLALAEVGDELTVAVATVAVAAVTVKEAAIATVDACAIGTPIAPAPSRST